MSSYISTTRIDKTYSYTIAIYCFSYIAIAILLQLYIAILLQLYIAIYSYSYTCRMMLVARSPLKLHERICFVENYSYKYSASSYCTYFDRALSFSHKMTLPIHGYHTVTCMHAQKNSYINSYTRSLQFNIITCMLQKSFGIGDLLSGGPLHETFFKLYHCVQLQLHIQLHGLKTIMKLESHSENINIKS